MLSAAFKFYGIFKENSADLSGYSVMNNNITLVKYSLLSSAELSYFEGQGVKMKMKHVQTWAAMDEKMKCINVKMEGRAKSVERFFFGIIPRQSPHFGIRFPYPPILYRAGPSRYMGPHSNEPLIQ